MAVSPVDPQQMMVNCDMSGAYVARDGGRHLADDPPQAARRQHPLLAVYHLTIAKRIYAVGGNNELQVSDDAGVTWQPVLRGKAPWKAPVDFLGLVAMPCEYMRSSSANTATERTWFTNVRRNAVRVCGEGLSARTST